MFQVKTACHIQYDIYHRQISYEYVHGPNCDKAIQ